MLWQLVAANGERIEDAEEVCRAALGATISRYPLSPPITECEYEDTLSHVREQAIVQARLYRGGDAGSSLRLFLLERLRFRTVDYWRHLWSRNGDRRFVAEPSGPELDDGWVIDPADPNEGSREDRLADAFEAGAYGPDDRLADLGWAHAARDRRLLREAGKLGLGAGLRAAALAGSTTLDALTAASQVADLEEVAA